MHNLVGQESSYHIPPCQRMPQASDAWWCKVNPNRIEIKILDCAGQTVREKTVYQCVVCQKLEGRPYRVPLPLPLPESGVKEEPPSPLLEWTIMSRIERVDETYEKSLDGDYYEKLLHGKNDEKSQEG